MKKISILAVAALAMFSCSKNVNVNPDVPATGNQVAFTGMISNMNRGSYTAMDDKANTVVAIDGDKFGVFMSDQSNNVVVANAEFTFEDNMMKADYSTTPANGLTWQTLVDASNTTPKLNFYSYYPYDSNVTDGKNISIEIPSTQTMGEKDAEGNYTTQRTVTANDFLYSENVSTAKDPNQTIMFDKNSVPTSRTVNFHYKHALAFVEFNIVKNQAIADNIWFDGLTLDGTKIYNTAKFDLKESKLTVTKTAKALTIAPDDNILGQDTCKLITETDKANSKVIYQMLVMPMDATTLLADSKIALECKKNTDDDYSGATELKVGQSFPVGTKWEAGKRYKYNLIVSENTVRIVLLSIDDWEEQAPEDLPATPIA
ncbi:MAG: fimbrillin family protein [Rikenellaceae bacterium]|nr:fimbrillin family protein [Rikenellaceae bacterium]